MNCFFPQHCQLVKVRKIYAMSGILVLGEEGGGRTCKVWIGKYPWRSERLEACMLACDEEVRDAGMKSKWISKGEFFCRLKF
jgi:hypothetical protein